MKRFMTTAFLIHALVTLVLALSLEGCIFVAGAAIGAAAIAIVYDHRTIQNVLSDTEMSNKIADKIKTNSHLRNDSHIEVSVFNHVVLLTGQTPNAAWREEAEVLAKSVPNTTRIYNQISIQGPTSSLTRTSDSWVTTKIKSQMLATQDLKSSSIKVITENGVVYLMGMVSRQQADIAVDIARQVQGVQKVIKVFQYTN
jgi:osmotically-inducible protein OsmY